MREMKKGLRLADLFSVSDSPFAICVIMITL